MAGLDIPTGQLTDHGDVVQALASTGPGITPVSGVTPVEPALPDNRFDPAAQGGVFDAAGQQADIMASGEADARSAMSAGMGAKTSMVHGYAAEMLPLGSAPYQIDIPTVPEDATAPASDFLWSQGDQPGRET